MHPSCSWRRRWAWLAPLCVQYTAATCRRVLTSSLQLPGAPAAPALCNKPAWLLAPWCCDRLRLPCQIWAAIEAVYSFSTAGWAALCSATASLSLGGLILELQPSRSVPVRISPPSDLISALFVESTGISHTNLRSRLSTDVDNI